MPIRVPRDKWSRLPQFEEFHLELGYCVAAWAQVDEALFEIFRRCVGPWHQCAIIYYRSPGLDIRRGLVDELVRYILPKPAEKSGHPHPDVKEWAAAVKGMADLLSTRRRVAHQQVGISMYLDIVAERPTFKPVMEVFASHHERLRGKDEDSLDIEVLKKHQQDVRQLSERLTDFRENTLEKYAAELPPQVPPPWSAKD